MTSALFPDVLSARARRVSLSPIAAAGQRAAQLAAQGRSIITLTSGEPDFDTPQAIKDAAQDALDRGQTKYTPTAGTAALRRAVAEDYSARLALPIDARQVIISDGGKQVIYLAFAAVLNDGDEVIIPTPYWPSFLDSVKVNDGTPMLVDTRAEDGFKLTAAALEKAITPRTKWLVLNSPGNPTGAVYGADELKALAEVLRRHPHVLVLWDEMYDKIWFGEQAPTPFLTVAPDLQDRTLIVNGVSKTYAMTGWRIGWGVGPAALIQAFEAVQSQVSSGPSSVGQAAALAGLQGVAGKFSATAREAYRLRARRLVKGLSQVPGLDVFEPHGSFFAWIGVAGLIGRVRPDGHRIERDRDVVDWLLESAGVAVVHGAAYGLSPYFRVSFAASDADIAEAVIRIGQAVAALRPEHAAA